MKAKTGIIARNQIRYGGRGYSIENTDRLIFEDNLIAGNNLLSIGNDITTFWSNYCRNIYFARNHLQQMFGADREMMTLDAGGGAYYGRVAAVNGTRLRLAGDPAFRDYAPTPHTDWSGAAVMVRDGRGAGQYRLVTQHAGRQWEVDRPWLVPPDATSRISIAPFRGRDLFVGNTFEDGGAFQLYGAAVDSILAGNPTLPQAWWALNAEGKRWSGWPGYYRINARLPDVLQYNLDKVNSRILAHPCFDGVFYDCWHVEAWLDPKTAELRGGRAIVMINDWNLPRRGFDVLNGCLAEDEFNRVMEGKVDFEDFLSRYFRWCRESRRPAVTMLVGHPRGMNMDPWYWHNLSWAERAKARDALKDSDPQALRFGLCTALMGDGYFGYDCANNGRGQWWWFPEFDAPLGYPQGPAHRNPDGTWQRSFDGGLVVVNGSQYDSVVAVHANHRDFSNGRVARRFTVPMLDGRILLPTTDRASGGSDPDPRVTAQPPKTLQVTDLGDGLWAVQTPHGLDLRVASGGMLRNILWHGKTLCTGGWPSATNVHQAAFLPATAQPPQIDTSGGRAEFKFQGTLAAGEQKVDYTERLTVAADNRFTLQFHFTAQTNLALRLWRHYLAFPVAQYRGAVAQSERGKVTLPATLGEANLLPAGRKFVLQGPAATIEVESSVNLSLVDHRKWNTQEYLLAGYPVRGNVKGGTEWTVEMRVGADPAVKR